MSLIAQIIGRTVTSIVESDITGATQLVDSIFAKCNKLVSCNFPATVKKLGISTFSQCTSLKSIDLKSVELVSTSCFYKCTSLSKVNTDNIPETCRIIYSAFSETPWFNSLPDGINLLCNGKILFYLKNITTVEVPESVRTISPIVFDKITDDHIIIPDTVVRILSDPLGTNKVTTKVTIGSGVQQMGAGTMSNTKVTDWICRQPSDMIIDMPEEAGDGKGLAYDKDSRSFTLYTDNEMLKAYNWSGDNVTATIKPLSEAPV